ncbi:MAG: hemolysin family protein [Chlamydiota bacterium]|nr:hemolysin family protein [Chlamydiota bacterium]
MIKIMGLDIVSLIILLMLSAFFSGTETGVFSLRKTRIKKLQNEKGKSARVLSQLLKNPKKILIGVLAGNLFVNILASSISERVFSQWFLTWGLGFSVIAMTVLLLVFGEIIPKVISIHIAERWALAVAYPLKGIMFLASPVNRLLIWLNDWLVHHLMTRESMHITTEELHTAVDVGHQAGVLDPRESKMIQGIIGLGKRTVKEFMRPRDEIFACDIHEPMDIIYDKIRQHKFSRIPMYKDNLDEIAGILYGKDLVMKEITQFRAIQVYDLLRAPFFVPELMKGDHLFREFRKRRNHMAIVVDEFGSVSGLVTLEDVMEEIVGEVVDKQDITPLYTMAHPNQIQVNARMEIRRFNEIFSAFLEDPSAVTMGGFLINRMGKIPHQGERVIFGNLEFEILSAHRRSIENIQVTRIVHQEDH